MLNIEGQIKNICIST